MSRNEEKVTANAEVLGKRCGSTSNGTSPAGRRRPLEDAPAWYDAAADLADVAIGP